MERQTKQRRAILEYLRQKDRHPTAEEIYRGLRPHMPRLSLATVYRNLENLVQEGQIERVPNTQPVRYEGIADGHAHLLCTECGQVCDLWPTGELVNMDALDTTAQITGYEILLRGVCPQCAAKHKTA